MLDEQLAFEKLKHLKSQFDSEGCNTYKDITVHEQGCNTYKTVESDKGCNTYNKDNEEKEDKKNNKVNPLGSSSLGSLPAARPIGQQELLDSRAEPDSGLLDCNRIKSAIIQFIDNGEKHRQRYKLKVRINLTTKQNVEFIAPMNKNIQDFKRHIPGDRDKILKLAYDTRQEIKTQYDIWPYIGKFHFNTKSRNINIEPDTFAAVWYSNLDQGWMCLVKIQNWFNCWDLPNDRLTNKQEQIGVKGQAVYNNPAYDARIRPLTWQQMREQGVF
jgi:hypothetical protein